MDKNNKKNTKVAINETTTVLPKTDASMSDLLAIENRMDNIFNSARKSTVDIAECITTLQYTKAFVLKGYASTEEFCEKEYGIKKTQVNLALRIVAKYCTEENKKAGRFTIEDKYKFYGADKLDIIQKLDNFSLENFDALVESLEITPKTTLADLKQIYRTSKGIEQKDKQETEDKQDKQETEDNITTQLKQANDKKSAQLDNIKDLLIHLYQDALNETMEDADFRAKAKDVLQRIEKTYK